jgi:3-methyladenine DNA glycosylase/8-oxoguanine DNA glycosylase
VLAVRGGLVSRLLHVERRPVLVRACFHGEDVLLVADALDPSSIQRPGELPGRFAAPRPGRGSTPPAAGASEPEEPARREQLEAAIERMRFALGVDEDLRPFYERFRSERLLGPAIRRRPWLRPRRRPWPWEALAWAIVNQLIEAQRAAAIERRIVRRWGASVELAAGSVEDEGRRSQVAGRRFAPALRDVPEPGLIAGRAPAELTALDLAPGRSVTLIRAAREVAAGRADPADAGSDARLRRIPGIGPWTLRCLGLGGRGDPDSLPAGDLAYLKLVGRLAGLGRRASVEEVEEFFAPYVPYRGLAGTFVLAEYHRLVGVGPPLRHAA